MPALFLGLSPSAKMLGINTLKVAPMVEYDYVKTKREDVPVFEEKHMKFAKPIMRWYTKMNVWVYKASKGRMWNTFPGGYPICVLGSKGAKSGAWREVALIHLPHGDKELLVASQGGAEKSPLWFYNVRANPEVEVTVMGVTRKMLARRVSDEEKAALWPHLLSLYPDFDEYQARTDRNIPVFMCDEIS